MIVLPWIQREGETGAVYTSDNGVARNVTETTRLHTLTRI